MLSSSRILTYFSRNNMKDTHESAIFGKTPSEDFQNRLWNRMTTKPSIKTNVFVDNVQGLPMR